MSFEAERFRSDVFKIAGFALMTPIGKIFLQPLEFFREYGLIFSTLYSIGSLFLALIGFYLIIKCYNELIDYDRRK